MVVSRVCNTFVLLLVLFYCAGVYAATGSYTIARAPQLSAKVMEKIWSPFISHLENSTGYQFSLKIYSERHQFEKDIQQGSVDFYFGNPLYGVVGRQLHGYVPVIRSGNKKLKGIIVVRKDSPVEKLEDLENEKIVFPGETSFAASLLVRYALESRGIAIKGDYVNGHDNVYRNVLNGNYMAGGGIYRTLEGEPDVLKSQLRVIYETEGVCPHPLMAHPDLPKDVVQKVQNAILQLDETEKGKHLLKKIKISQPMMLSYDKECSILEEMSKKLYSHMYQ